MIYNIFFLINMFSYGKIKIEKNYLLKKYHDTEVS